MEKVLMKGNEAMAEAAVRAGCRYYFGYPITPQSEVPEYLAKRMPQVGGVFLQAESEVAAINMVYGAAAAGARTMTSSSSPGISLKLEGISYIAAAELPCVIVNIMRAGPGLGGIQPAQSDYFQATKGGGHGDYRLIVYAPSSVQELADMTYQAFDIADKYRNPVMILGDGLIGQMMEEVKLPKFKDTDAVMAVEKGWAATGTKEKRPPNIFNTLYLHPEKLEDLNLALFEKYRIIQSKEVTYEEYKTADADILLVAYGISARIAKSAIDEARNIGIKAGLIRPITLWPFPKAQIKLLSQKVKWILTLEMSHGQLIEDVCLAVGQNVPVHFYGRVGGMIPSVEAVYHEICLYAGVHDDVLPETDKGIRYTYGEV